jgi:hypothetical protein
VYRTELPTAREWISGAGRARVIMSDASAAVLAMLARNEYDNPMPTTDS